MSQFDFGTIDPNVKDGVGLAADLNTWRNALHSSHSSTARPSYVLQHMLWVKTGTGTNENQLCYYDGADDIVIGTFNTSTNTFVANVSTTFEVGTDNLTTTSASTYQLTNVTTNDIDALDVNLGGVGQDATVDFTYNNTLKQITFASPPPVGVRLRVRG